MTELKEFVNWLKAQPTNKYVMIDVENCGFSFESFDLKGLLDDSFKIWKENKKK